MNLSPSAPPLSPVRHRVLGQDAGRVGGASAAELADGKRAGTDSPQRLATREGHCHRADVDGGTCIFTAQHVYCVVEVTILALLFPHR